jgi:hypothetical protein
VIAVLQCTLEQGPRAGWISIMRLVAHEWMSDGYIRQGRIIGVRSLFRGPLATLQGYPSELARRCRKLDRQA